jgi:hypothetical protein
MPFNGSGTYSPPSPPNFPAVSGAVITAAYYNTVINDIAAGITACITRDGQSSPTAAISWGAQNLINVATLGAVTGTFSGAITGATGAFSGVLTVGGNLTLNNNIYYRGKNLAGTVGRLLGVASTDVIFLGDVDNVYGTVVIRSGGADIINLTNAGNVGVGTSVPVSKFAVGGGDITLDNTYSYAIKNSGGTSISALTLNGSNTLQYAVTAAFTGAHQWYTGGVKVMEITAGGVLAIVGSSATLAGVAVATQTYVTSQGYITSAALSTYALLASPTFTGTPAAPTAAANTNTTQLATTAFVTTADNLKANLASPTFTGTPAAPTASNGTNTTQIATTAFVQSQNTATLASYALLASPALTGTPTTGGIEIGFRSIPRSTTITTAAIGDRGRCIAASAGITIPNAVFAAGDAVSIYNDSAASITITQGASLTLRLGGTTTTGNRTLAARGYATVWFNTSSEAIITGAGLS